MMNERCQASDEVARLEITAMHRRGFTLIELMVVVALVIVLVGMFVPVIGSAREMARRAVCTQHLKRVHHATHLYAFDNDQQVPLGHRGGRRQWNTMIYSGTSDKFVLFGRLYVADLMDKPETFYCPSEEAPGQSFDTPPNPWPPGTPGVNVQGGYASNPMGDRFDWGWDELPDELPRLNEIGAIPMLADGVGLPDRVDSRHVDGVNVLWTGGSVQWEERSQFDQPLSQCQGLSPSNNVYQDEIWAILANQPVAGP